MVKKALIYVTGLLFMAFGVAFSVNSSLGVSPVNSLPYVISRITGLDLGNCVIGIFAFYILGNTYQDYNHQNYKRFSSRILLFR